MKRTEWDAAVPIDTEEGLSLLAGALYQRAAMIVEETEKLASVAHAVLEGAPPPDGYCVDAGETALYDGFAAQARSDLNNLSLFLESLKVSDETLEKAKRATAKSFRWRWYHFRDYPALILNVKPECAGWAGEQSTPIAQRQNDNLTKELRGLFNQEYWRHAERERTGRERTGPDFPTSDSDWAIYWATIDFHEEPKGVGVPTGRRWADGAHHAAVRAWSIRDEARRAGRKISDTEAIETALLDFDIVGEGEFDDHPDKESTVVSNGGYGTDGRHEGAVTAVRKLLSESDRLEEQMDR